MINIKEKDLFKPINDYLIENGYEVHSEVKNCDIIAEKNDDLIVIELKKNLSIKLLSQALRRQKITDSVYVAVPKPKKYKSFRDTFPILKKLELGLIIVDFKKTDPTVEVAFHPKIYKIKKNNKLKRSIINEINGRSGNYNVGGSVKEKIMTAYKENVIHIATCLEKYEELSPKELRKLGTSHKTQSILSKNFYGWFDKVSRGVYTLNENGKCALNNYSEIADNYRNLIKNTEVHSKKE